MSSACPCGSGLDFSACCGPLLAGTPAASAEALMRSRYTAFTRGDLAYLEQTLAPETRDSFNRAEIERIMREVTWLGLEIRPAPTPAAADADTDTGAIAGDSTAAALTDTVEFIARFRRGQDTLAHHERSRFRQEDGVWLYVDGDLNPKAPPRSVVRIGRNDPCPCGSGKKYKKCCGAAGSP